MKLFSYITAPNPALAAKRGHVRVSSLDFKTNNQQTSSQQQPQDETYDKSQVVAVGTALPTLNMPSSALQSQVMVSVACCDSVSLCSVFCLFRTAVLDKFSCDIL